MTREEDRKEVCETFVMNRSIMRHFLKKRKKERKMRLEAPYYSRDGWRAGAAGPGVQGVVGGDVPDG